MTHERKIPDGTLVFQHDNTGKLLVVTGHSEANDMYYVTYALDENGRQSAEFGNDIRPATLVQLCALRTKLDMLINEFAKSSST